MSSSSALPIRGASPAAIGIATAGISGSKAATLNASIQAISTAGNMNELIDTIPSRYRPLLAPILREMQDIHGKFCNAQKNLASLRAHQSNGTWLSFLAGMHDPFASIQTSKEARSPLSHALGESQTWFRVLKEEALSKVIALKEAEVECLEKLYSSPVIRGRCSSELDNDWAALKKALGKHTEDDGSGKGIAISGFFKTEFASASSFLGRQELELYEDKIHKTLRGIGEEAGTCAASEGCNGLRPRWRSSLGHGAESRRSCFMATK